MIDAAQGTPAAPVLELLGARDPEVEAIWRALETKARPPYFLTWGWIGTWISCLPRTEAPTLAALFGGDVPLAAFFLGRQRIVRRVFVRSRALYLNATGCARWDELTLEHNAILCSRPAPLTLTALAEALPEDWDELVLPALSRSDFPGNALGEPLARHVVRVDRESPAPFVDLAKVRASAGGYLALLGSSTRAQLRRAERGFGTLELRVAADRGEAADVYDELVELHTATWRRRGLPGAFADPWFDEFHRRLIADRFDHGEVQLLRLRSRGKTIGCLYNLVSSGRVLFYQSGLATFDDPQLKPGYLCHAAAVRHNAALGHAVYDFLEGDVRYKRNLATDEARLVWARVQRPLARFAVEDRLRRWKRAPPRS